MSITVAKERNAAFDTCSSCGAINQMHSVTITRVFDERSSSGTAIHLCNNCLLDLARNAFDAAEGTITLIDD